MKDILSTILGIIIIILVVCGISWMLTGNSLLLSKTFAPQFEDVRRETFEHSKAYNQGMIQELQNMQFEYIKASPEHKAALASIILHRAADYDENNMPPDLRLFIKELKRGVK